MRRILPAVLAAAVCFVTTQALAGAIVGGREAREADESRPRDAPWTVELVFENPDPKWEGAHVCGGALIAPRWVLTAAHCVTDEYNRQANLPGWVIAGTVKQGAGVKPGVIDPRAWSSRIAWDGHHVFVCGHQSAIACGPFSPSTRTTFSRNDIALIHLVSAPPFGDRRTIDTIAVDDDATDHPGDRAWITGWGATSEAASEQAHVAASPELKIASLQLLPSQVCQERTIARYAGVMSAASWPDSVICAGPMAPRGGAQAAGPPAVQDDVCRGDSGGPLTRARSVGGGALTGVASWELICGGGNAGLYTRVAKFKPWIDEIIAANGGPG